jgi:Xaa-Pro aminopeptidase
MNSVINNLFSRLKKNRSIQKSAFFVSSKYNVNYIINSSSNTIKNREVFLIITFKKIFYLYSSLIKPDDNLSELLKLEMVKFSTYEDLISKIKIIIFQNRISTLFFENYDLKVIEFTRIQSRVKIECKPVNTLFEQIRSLKNENEINNIKKACHLADKAMFFAATKFKTGITEISLKNQIADHISKQNCELAFDTIVSFGKNTAIPHHQSDNNSLQKKDIILIDLGVKFNNYCSDITRVFFHHNTETTIRKIYDFVHNAQKIALKMLKPGINGKDVDKKIQKFIRNTGNIPYSHGLGHGLGLEIHELPKLHRKYNYFLSKNNVITIEPGIYIPYCFGVRLEDTVLVTDNGYDSLTSFSK